LHLYFFKLIKLKTTNAYYKNIYSTMCMCGWNYATCIMYQCVTPACNRENHSILVWHSEVDSRESSVQVCYSAQKYLKNYVNMNSSWPDWLQQIIPARRLAVNSTIGTVYLYDYQPEMVKQCYSCKFMLKLLWCVANNRGQSIANCINAVPATCVLCLNSTSVVLSYSGNTTIQLFVDNIGVECGRSAPKGGGQRGCRPPPPHQYKN
jgi:hypothetical protein